MHRPVSLQFGNRICECVVCITIVYRSLVLCSIEMNRITVAKPMGIIIAHYGKPLAIVHDFDLNGVLDNALSTTLISAAKPHFVRQNVD